MKRIHRFTVVSKCQVGCSSSGRREGSRIVLFPDAQPSQLPIPRLLHQHQTSAIISLNQMLHKSRCRTLFLRSSLLAKLALSCYIPSE